MTKFTLQEISEKDAEKLQQAISGLDKIEEQLFDLKATDDFNDLNESDENDFDAKKETKKYKKELDIDSLLSKIKKQSKNEDISDVLVRLSARNEQLLLEETLNTQTKQKYVFIENVHDILNLEQGESGIYWTGHLASAIYENKALEEIQNHIMKECYEVDGCVSSEEIIKNKKNSPYSLMQKPSKSKIAFVQKAFDYIITKK